ncbi:galactose mutarotase-like domain-containing protein [Umbelopsis sp. PMI_123]|nr:galactose mutarotase-like domain-containing protein [Umbelopsis sp. PMI_123]
MPAHETSHKSILLKHPSGAEAEVRLFGATVTSWKVDGTERLFVSDNAILDGSKAIRGGIPVVFPIFGTDEKINLPQHGFARNSDWEYVGILTDNDEVSIRFSLKDNQLKQAQRSAWSHSFRLNYTVALTAKSLRTTLVVKNEDEDTFEFKSLLHTYFQVSDISKVAVNGLSNLTYIDKVLNAAKVVEENQKVTVAGEVDRVYVNVPEEVTIEEGGQPKYSIVKTGMKDTVVWNPWVDKAKAMGDFGDEEYHNMICVEVGSVAEWVKLGGGKTWTGGQVITVL